MFGKCSTVILKTSIGLLLFLTAGVSFAQLGGSPERVALKNMEKHRWQKVETRLRKSLHKDSLNPSIRYLLSVFYFHADNPESDLDSAYHYAVSALEDFVISPSRERDRLNRMSIDSLGLIGLRAKIDSTAFEEARKLNTEEAYLEFLSHFTSAVQRDLAAELRDEVAYQGALKQNSYQAFLHYLQRYPEAKRAPEARAHYDRLLYKAETKDQRLSSYEKFLVDHPETPYRNEIYRHIFEISTAGGSVQSFLDFMSRYPLSDQGKRAAQIVFHILAEEENPQWAPGFLNDSLRNLLAVNQTYLVPVLRNDLYGFIDENGKEVLAPAFKNIHPDYLCGAITDELLVLGDQLVARNGRPVYEGKVDDVTDLGIGYLKIRSAGGMKLIHKAGIVFKDSLEDARILDRQYVAVKQNSEWLLYTLAGRLLEEGWDDITAFQDIIVLKRAGKVFIAPKGELCKRADRLTINLSEPFDEVKPWPQGLIWGRSGDFEGVLDRSLHGVIGFDKHTLTQTFFGATAMLPNGFALHNWTGRKSTTFEKVMIAGPWVTVKKNGSWFLFEPRSHEIKSKAYDSLRAEGPFMVGLLKDTLYVHFEGNHTAAFYRPHGVSFIPGRDSTSFLVVEENAREKTIFDLQGRRLFSASFDAIEYAGQGIFVITRKNKKGLVDFEGVNLLPAEFDAIGSASNAVLSVLKNKRFGAYSIRQRKWIKPLYDRNLLPYTETLLMTFKEGYYGFVGWDNKSLSPFEFDEIMYWDDSVALVRRGSYWSLYDIVAGKVILGNIRKINFVKNSPDEKIAIIQKDNNYGVITNRRNILIPVTFSDIMNLGTADEPLYFTEKHIREASLFIVIYYDRAGNMLRKEIYDEAADYDRIYCSDL